MTQNPIWTTPLVPSNGFLDNQAYSMCDNWGSYAFPDCPFPPEYAAYQAQPYTYANDFLSKEESYAVMSTSYSWYGLQNIYNGMMLFRDFEIVKKNWVSPSQYWTDTAAHYGMSSSRLQNLLKFLEWQSTEWLSGGVTLSHSQYDLVHGFETSFVDKINSDGASPVGALLKGNIYVDPAVTPFLNLWMGPTANRAFTMLAG